MVSLSTHVLDLYSGVPAEKVKIDVYFQNELLKTVYTNANGRVDEQLVTEETGQAGTYELVFYVEDYYNAKKVELPEQHFLTTVPVRFTMTESSSHYHIPLLVTPWGYQVYRGS